MKLNLRHIAKPGLVALSLIVLAACGSQTSPAAPPQTPDVNTATTSQTAGDSSGGQAGDATAANGTGSVAPISAQSTLPAPALANGGLSFASVPASATAASGTAAPAADPTGGLGSFFSAPLNMVTSLTTGLTTLTGGLLSGGGSGLLSFATGGLIGGSPAPAPAPSN